MISTHNVIGEEKNYKLKDSNPVPIHDLYANMQFWFSYPLSETQSYYLLQDCLVALYYQLYFLECQTFSGYTEGYGWGYCKYGDGVKCEDVDGTGCLSWICSLGNGSQGAHGNVTSGSGNQCGSSASNPSPLQAFLTDCLKGFTCEEVDTAKLKTLTSNNHKDYSKCYPQFLEHRGHTKVFGQECAVPMGFSGSFRSGGPIAKQAAAGQDNGMIGLGIYALLEYYSNSNMATASLYQVTRCICSLTRRVPRSTGTLYGFFYSIGGMCKKDYSGNGQVVHSALKGEMGRCPGWREPECLMGALFNWRGVTHRPGQPGYHENGTLDSLNRCNDAKATCGHYLNPITGYLYNSLSDRFCETYVSWIVHLTWRLQSGLKSLREAFKDISCEDCKCKKSTKCKAGGCTKGTHDSKCCCESVADCAGVLGLFYRFGFNYIDAYKVAGKGGNGNTDKKRTCKQFSEHLGKVIEGTYYKALQTQLRNFIYSTRALFGVYVTAFWSIVIVYLLWSITGPLDLLHIQSHWKPAQSHLVPLQRILADGSRKGFCTLGYFQDGTGNGLLEINDLYL
ncbi:variant erythrocyte surface antigen beta subunit, putative [Babesia ovis]|uniref:Variant erythrocyte surface antigen beta subunit, putative n=1 Tax=Babesia ovis TaxID=5869 RepID=A0A9W5WTG3_BABOV|nr:variant erythrocyte surface antigen beta subunit, putative [Babesia ovis]